MKVSTSRMATYRDSGQKLLPRTPVIIEIQPKTSDVSIFKDGHFMPGVLAPVCGALENVVFGYTDFSSLDLLLADYPSWENFSFRDPQILSSLAASSAATASEHPILFAARSFNLPKDEVVNYFIWKQMCLAGRLLKMDGANPDAVLAAEFVRSGPSGALSRWPGSWWRGRACTKVAAPLEPDAPGPNWFWDIDTSTPDFSVDKDYINAFTYGHR